MIYVCIPRDYRSEADLETGAEQSAATPDLKVRRALVYLRCHIPALTASFFGQKTELVKREFRIPKGVLLLDNRRSMSPSSSHTVRKIFE